MSIMVKIQPASVCRYKTVTTSLFKTIGQYSWEMYVLY